MSLASTYDGKVRVINDILSKSSPDERKIMLQLLIKMDMKAYFEVIWEEQKRLEDEAGVKGVCEYTSDKVWIDGEEQTEFGENVQSGLEVNLAEKVSKEAENAYYLDEKIAKKQGNDKFDGFLGYINNSSGEEEEPETTLEPGEFVDDFMDKLESKINELEMKNKMKNMKTHDFGGDNK